MISDKDIIIELLRQREELREAASNNSEDHKVVNQLHATISALKKERDQILAEQAKLDADWMKKPNSSEWRNIPDNPTKTEPREYRFKHRGMDYVVVNVEAHTLELLRQLDNLVEERDALSKDNRSKQSYIEELKEGIDAWKIRHDDLAKRSVELRAKYDQSAKELDNAKSILRDRTEYGSYRVPPDQTIKQPPQNQ